MKRLIVLSLTSLLWACSGGDSNSGSRSQETTSAPPVTIELQRHLSQRKCNHYEVTGLIALIL